MKKGKEDISYMVGIQIVCSKPPELNPYVSKKCLVNAKFVDKRIKQIIAFADRQNNLYDEIAIIQSAIFHLINSRLDLEKPHLIRWLCEILPYAKEQEKKIKKLGRAVNKLYGN